MNPKQNSFLQHITTVQNRQLLLLSLGIAIVYFILLRIIYPIPSYCGDSYTFIATARFDYPVSYRPILYSKYLNFFHNFSTSDVALIAAQYLSNVVANLFLFFTCTWILPIKKLYRNILFVLLICNPFYIFYSNYITSDPFFNSFTVAWFALLIWMMYRPSWAVIILQIVLLSQLFLLRYNAIIFPVFMWLAVFLGKNSNAKKVVSIVTSVVMIGVIIYITKQKTLQHTGINTFTAFSGWQLANNALHILRYEDADTLGIEDKQVKHLINYCKTYFDTTALNVPAISSHYMWFYKSPLKEYTKVYQGRDKYFFKTWTALGPVYNKFGKAVILNNPIGYLQHFILPNTKEYFYPKMEIYKNYFEHVDTIGLMAKQYYNYNGTKIPAKKQAVYDVVFTPWKLLFPLLNIIFLFLVGWYLLNKKYKDQTSIFNQTLLIYAALFFANFFFIVLLAPSVFRYHIFVITLAYPMIILLIQQYLNRENKT